MDPQECMYVCLRRPSMYVCMFEALKHVCMPQTYIHKSNIHTLLNFLEFHIFESFSDAFKHVCMFQIPLPVMENETYTLKYTRSIHLKPCFAYLNKYV